MLIGHQVHVIDISLLPQGFHAAREILSSRLILVLPANHYVLTPLCSGFREIARLMERFFFYRPNQSTFCIAKFIVMQETRLGGVMRSKNRPHDHT